MEEQVKGRVKHIVTFVAGARVSIYIGSNGQEQYGGAKSMEKLNM